MMSTWKAMIDDLGPEKIVFISDAEVGLKAIVVVDNVACGPAIGGVRMSKTVDVDEVRRLARAMTMKNAAAGLAAGGAKSGIIADPAMPAEQKRTLIRAFARAIRDIRDYIPGPDMGTDESSMALIRGEGGQSVGLPRVVGGIPLDEIGATAWGLAASAEAAQELVGFDLRGARVAIQGFGAVGAHAARFLSERGAVIVAAADSRGAMVNLEGLDVPALLAHKRGGESVHSFRGGKPIDGEDLVGVPCDIWVPAAQPDVLRADNVDRLQARLVLPGANIPATAEAERMLHERGVVMVPDYIANAGGVICAYVEHHGGTQRQAMSAVQDKVATNTDEVLTRADAEGIMPRAAADAIAEARVREAQSYRRRVAPATTPRANLLDM
jgi:glutamate dehydrogenase/leucine dehydrogenase